MSNTFWFASVLGGLLNPTAFAWYPKAFGFWHLFVTASGLEGMSKAATGTAALAGPGDSTAVLILKLRFEADDAVDMVVFNATVMTLIAGEGEMLGMGPRFKGAMLLPCAWRQGVAANTLFPQEEWTGCGLCALGEHECCQDKRQGYHPPCSSCVLASLFHGSGQVAAPGV